MTTSTRRRAKLAAALMAPILLAACQPSILDPQGSIGVAERTILIDSLAIMLAIVLPTIAATFACAWWFRASNTRARYLPEWAHSGSLELIVWAIPVLVIILVGGVTWVGAHDLDPAVPIASKSPPVEVQVVSLDWKWLFIYPGQNIATVNQLVVPAGVPIHLTLTSASVLNSFFVPQLGSMIYTMNGMATQLYLDTEQPGTFHGLSSHFSGDGFADMHFEMRAVPAQEFASWAAGLHNTGSTLDATSYAALARQSIDVAPFSYRAVDQGLFQKIVSQQVPAGPGPQIGQPDPGTSSRTER